MGGIRTVKEEKFPFSIQGKFTSVDHAKIRGWDSSHIWAVAHDGNQVCYGPPHYQEGVSYFVTTDEQHDCGTFYLEEITDETKDTKS